MSDRCWYWETIARARRGGPAAWGICYRGSRKAALRQARKTTHRRIRITEDGAPEPARD